jgi:nucleoside phosphorylase
MTHEADILIITVTEVETLTAISAFEQANGFNEKEELINNRLYHNLGQIGSARVFLRRQSEMGSGGQGGSLLTVSKGIEDLSPLAVIMVGIAFGRDENTQKLGDILVAKQVCPYEFKRVGEDKTISRSEKLPASSMLIDLFNRAGQQWNISNELKVRFGKVLSGDKLIDNKEFRDQLFKDEPEAIGGEMEGAGLSAACQSEKVDWILVKSICDWGYDKSEDRDSRQETAARQATAFVVDTLRFSSIDWQQQRHEFSAGKTSSILSAHLFDRLETLHINAYRLLCRLGCYSYKDISDLNRESILSLLWDTPQETEQIEIIESLSSHFLIDCKNNKYSLHSAIYHEAKYRLESSMEERDKTNIQVAEFYSRNIVDITNPTQVKSAHQAINHYCKARKYKKCHKMLLHILDAEENLSNLRCSDNLWRYDSTIIEICEQLINSNGLIGSEKALTLIPLGILYPEVGKNEKAAGISTKILNITDPLISDSKNNSRVRIAEIAAHLIAGRANKNIGNISKAEAACREASKSAKYIDKSIAREWQAFALYELGTVYLEEAKTNEFFSEETVHKAWAALSLIAQSAFLSINREIPIKFYKLFTTPSEIQDKAAIFEDIENYANTLEDDSYTKRFRILHNAGKCLRLIKFMPISLSRAVLKYALSILPETDDLNKAWSHLELALCSPSRAEYYYERVLEKYDNLKPVCQVHFLLEYGKFKFGSKQYLQAISLHLKLEKLLDNTEFESLKAFNYYSISLAYSRLSATEKKTIHNEINKDRILFCLQESARICGELGLAYEVKVQELYTIIQPESTP